MTGAHPDLTLAVFLTASAVVGLCVYPASRFVATLMWFSELQVGLLMRYVFVGDREALALPLMAALFGVEGLALSLVVVYRQRAAMRKGQKTGP